MNKTDRQLQIANEVIDCSNRIKEQLSSMPSFRKGGLIKTYNRRPMKRKRQSKILCQVAINVVFSSLNIYRHLSMPIPKRQPVETKYPQLKNYRGESI